MSLVSDKRISYAYAWALSAIALAFVLAQFLFLPAVETIDYIALMNKDYRKAKFKNRRMLSR